MLLWADLKPYRAKRFIHKVLFISTPKFHKITYIFTVVFTIQCQRKINRGKSIPRKEEKRDLLHAKDIYFFAFTTAFHSSITEFMTLDTTQLPQHILPLHSWNIVTEKEI